MFCVGQIVYFDKGVKATIEAIGLDRFHNQAYKIAGTWHRFEHIHKLNE